MTDTNQLPTHTITINDHPEPHIMQWSDLELAAIKKYAESYAMQARAQVQDELKPYDAGLLNDFGGGNVEWWQDYIRAELGHAHDFYQSQVTTPQPAQATQAEVTDQLIESEFKRCGGKWNGDQWVIEDADLHPFCRTILALRPVQVPMTDAAREHFLRGYESAQQDALVCHLPPEGWACTRTAGHEGPCAAVPTDEGALVKRGMDRLRESHHGIAAQAKKETP